MSSNSKRTFNKYTPIPKSKDYEINTPNCDITLLNLRNVKIFINII